MTKEELQKLYGEAVLETKIWSARATEFERQLVDLMNKESKEKKENKPCLH